MHTPRVIAISSGKGGVGKTLISAHLAIRAVQRGQRVLLIDADTGLSDIDILLGLPQHIGLQDLLENGASFSDALTTTPYGFDLLPGSSGSHNITRLSNIQKQLLLDEIREAGANYDLILIDTATGIDDSVLYFVSAAESALIVVTPDPASLADAYSLIKVLSQTRQMHRFMIVINQAEAIEAQTIFRRLLSITDRYLDVCLDYVGHIKQSNSIRSLIRTQALLDLSSSGHTTRQLNHALDTVLSHPREKNHSGLQFFWQHNLDTETRHAA